MLPLDYEKHIRRAYVINEAGKLTVDSYSRLTGSHLAEKQVKGVVDHGTGQQIVGPERIAELFLD